MRNGFRESLVWVWSRSEVMYAKGSKAHGKAFRFRLALLAYTCLSTSLINNNHDIQKFQLSCFKSLPLSQFVL